MPKLGLSHDLFSGRHPDTSPPAGGADPDDGQVATWSAALKAWIAADAAGGVTDHGLLTGLVPDDDHTQYALLAGRGTSQDLAGGLSSGKLYLRPYGGATDGVIELAATDPDVKAVGSVYFPNHIGIGDVESYGDTGILVHIRKNPGGGLIGLAASVGGLYAGSSSSAIEGVAGRASSTPGEAMVGVMGLSYMAVHAQSEACANIKGIFMRVGSLGAGALTNLYNFHGEKPIITGDRPNYSYGLFMEDQSKAGIDETYNLKIDEADSSTLNRTVYFGDATPDMYLEGNYVVANKAALVLNFGGTLYRVIRNAGTGALETEAP